MQKDVQFLDEFQDFLNVEQKKFLNCLTQDCLY